MNKIKKAVDFIGIRETLFDSDYAILRCLLYCAFDDDFQESSPEITKKDEKTRTSIINFLESNNRICQFTESLVTNLRNPKENPNEVLRTDGEDTWFITYYLKRLCIPYLKELVFPIINSIDKAFSVENLTEEKKIETAIELCAKFIKSMMKKIDLLPKVFFGVLHVIRTHFVNSWKDGVVSLIFLRIFYPAILTPDTYLVDTEKSPSPTPKKLKKSPSNVNTFLKFFKLIVNGPTNELDSEIKVHMDKLVELHNTILEFINKITDGNKFAKQLNKEKKSKSGSKKTQSIVLSLKKHVSKISKKIDNYASIQSSSKVNINLLIDYLNEKVKERLDAIPSKIKSTKVQSDPTLFREPSLKSTRDSQDSFSFEEMINVEMAPKLLDEEVLEENNPYFSLKTTLRDYKSFTKFRSFLKNEFNSEPIDLYYNILKHKKISEDNFKLSSLKYIYSNFVDPNGRYCVNAPSDISEKFKSVISDEKQLLENDEDLSTKMISFIYFFLKEPHGRFIIEKNKLKCSNTRNSVEDL